MERWVEEKNGTIFLYIHVQPRASKNEIVGVHGDALKVRLTSPPVEGAANSLLVKFIAKSLGIPRSSVKIVSGEKSRHKMLRISEITQENIENILGISGQK